MSETPDESTEAIPAASPAVAPHTDAVEVPPHTHEASRLNKIAAWVGIVAGAVVIVAVIFGTGVMVGAHSGKHHGGGGGGGFDRHRESSQEHRGGPPMWGPGPGFGGPGGFGQGGPGGPGFGGGQGPGQQPAPPAGSTAPTPPNR